MESSMEAGQKFKYVSTNIIQKSHSRILLSEENRNTNSKRYIHTLFIATLSTTAKISVVLCLFTQSCPILCDPMDCSPPVSSVHGDSPGKNTGVGCHAQLHGILSTQGLNPGLPNCSQILYCLSRKTMITGMGHLSLLQGIF